MPWRHARLRDSRVLVRCEADGAPRAEGGRVEIRYRPRDGRPYRAAQGNLELLDDGVILPDDHCVEASAPAGEPARRKRSKAPAEVPTEAQGEELIAYADGACSGNPGPAGLGVVMLSREGRRELSEFIGTATNNIAELMAILRVLEAVDDTSRPVRVFTDSGYSIGVLQKGWKAKANVDLVRTVRAALARMGDAELFHVPGHAGVPLNERADELAREAVRSASTTGWTEV